MWIENEDGDIQGPLPDTDEGKQDYEDGFQDGASRKEPRKTDKIFYTMGYQHGRNSLLPDDDDDDDSLDEEE